jgi:hypothetical protein
MNEPVERAPPTPDPFASIAEPDKLRIEQIPCRTLAYVSDSTYTFDRLANGQEAIRFCGGLEIKATVSLKPGLYIIFRFAKRVGDRMGCTELNANRTS